MDSKTKQPSETSVKPTLCKLNLENAVAAVSVDAAYETIRGKFNWMTSSGTLRNRLDALMGGECASCVLNAAMRICILRMYKHIHIVHEASGNVRPLDPTVNADLDKALVCFLCLLLENNSSMELAARAATGLCRDVGYNSNELNAMFSQVYPSYASAAKLRTKTAMAAVSK